jgi:putative hemolysin
VPFGIWLRTEGLGLLIVLEAVLIEKGILDEAAMDAVVEYCEHQVGTRDQRMSVETLICRSALVRPLRPADYRSRVLVCP